MCLYTFFKRFLLNKSSLPKLFVSQRNWIPPCSRDKNKRYVICPTIICPKIIWFTKHLFCRSFVLQIFCHAVYLSYSSFVLNIIFPKSICPTHHVSFSRKNFSCPTASAPRLIYASFFLHNTCSTEIGKHQLSYTSIDLRFICLSFNLSYTTFVLHIICSTEREKH